MRQLADPGWLSRLGPAVVDFPELTTAFVATSCRISKRMRWHGTKLVEGYPVFVGAHRSCLMIVVCCAAFDDKFAVLVQQCGRLRGDASTSHWTVQERIEPMLLTAGLQLNVAQFWRYSSCGNLMVLH